MSKITKVKARQVFDSRGNPTIEAEVFTKNYSATTFEFCSPKFSIDNLRVSPAFKNCCGFMTIPTPGGVPVVIISPGCNDINLLR